MTYKYLISDNNDLSRNTYVNVPNKNDALDIGAHRLRTTNISIKTLLSRSVN